MFKRHVSAEPCLRLIVPGNIVLLAGVLIGSLFSLHSVARAQSPNGPTRLLRTPTVSATQIAFAYANNIWVVPRAGGSARRLTSFQGQTANPQFSPDGKWIAFSGEYAGNFDVYIVPAEGGEPRRLTWHPGADLVEGWTPDGKSILFSSTRATWARVARRVFGPFLSMVASKHQCRCLVLTRARSLLMGRILRIV